jgi:hypothetical protein
MGDRRVVSPIICKAQHRLALRHRTGAKRRVGALLRESSDPMRESGAPSTGEDNMLSVVCSPHRG